MFSLTDAAFVLAFISSAAGQSNLGGQGFVDLSVSGGTPDRKGAGILYGVPNGPAYSPQNAPPRSVWGPLFLEAGVSHVRAGGAQIPFPGYAADISNGNTAGYDARFSSTKQNYQDAKALDSSITFVLLPHDIWGADATTSSTQIYPCDNGDCTQWGKFLDKLIADLKSK
jgi:hypothetical protein